MPHMNYLLTQWPKLKMSKRRVSRSRDWPHNPSTLPFSSPSHHLLRTMNTPSATPVWLITGPSMGLERPLAAKALAITTTGTAEGVL